MKKNVLSKKLVMLISALSVTGLLLTGCSSSNKNTQANAATQSQGQQNQQNGKNFSANSEERKKQMEDSVNSLVSDGTITKDQGTKVLSALTSSTQRPNGQQNNNSSNNQGSANSNNQNNNEQSQNGQKSPSNQNGQSKGIRGNFNPLSKLVSDGTITQSQADKIMEKVRANMPQRQNNNGNNGTTNNNNNSTTNSSNTNSNTGS